MTRIAAADGCKDGWIVVEGELGEAIPTVLGTGLGIRETLALCNQLPTVLAIDLPIGLATDGQRAADQAARLFVGARRSSIFPTPVRSVVEYGQTIPDLAHVHRENVSVWAREHGHAGIGSQGFGIFPKICEFDTHLKRQADQSIHEFHPEVSWTAMIGDGSTLAPKSSANGILQRIRLIQHHLGEEVLNQPLPAGKYAIDDLLDALAGFWTAKRIASGTANTLPERPDVDQILGREIAIWY